LDFQHDHICKDATTDRLKSPNKNVRDLHPVAQGLLKVYQKNIVSFWRSIRSWMKMTEEAILYGVEMQWELNREPILSSLMVYEDPTARTLLGKAMVEARVNQIAKTLSEVRIDQSYAPAYSSIVDGKIATVADWNCVRMAGDKRAGQHYLRIYGKAGDMAGQLGRLTGAWDLDNRRAVQWAAENGAKMVTVVTEQTKQALREIVSNGLANGKGIGEIAREIRLTRGVGLNVPQSRALLNLTEKLKEAGVSE